MSDTRPRRVAPAVYVVALVLSALVGVVLASMEAADKHQSGPRQAIASAEHKALNDWNAAGEKHRIASEAAEASEDDAAVAAERASAAEEEKAYQRWRKADAAESRASDKDYANRDARDAARLWSIIALSLVFIAWACIDARTNESFRVILRSIALPVPMCASYALLAPADPHVDRFVIFGGMLGISAIACAIIGAVSAALTRNFRLGLDTMPVRLKESQYQTLAALFICQNVVAGILLLARPKLTAYIVSAACMLVLFLLFALFSSKLLYLSWKAVQDGHARTTPGKAVALLFVPLFNLYWAGVAWGGLADDINSYVARQKLSGPRVSRAMLLFAIYGGLAGEIIFRFSGAGIFLVLLGNVVAMVAIHQICSAVNSIPAPAESPATASDQDVMLSGSSR